MSRVGVALFPRGGVALFPQGGVALISKVGVALVSVVIVLNMAATPVSGQRPLRIASIESRPFLRQKDNTSEGNEQFEGFIKDILDEIKKVNPDMDYNLQLSDDETYGQEIEGTDDGKGNRRWSGLIGMAQRKEIDVIAADLTVTLKRMTVMDFSKPFMAATLTVLMKRWDYRGAMESWFAPYSWDLWLTLLAAYIVTGVVLWLVGRIAPKEKNPASTATPLTIRDAYWYLIACWFRASSFHPNAWSTRLISCCWWMFYLTVILVYFLLLPPHLAQPPLSANPVTVKQLFNNDITFGVVEAGSTHQLLENSHDPTHQAIWDKINANRNESFVKNYNEGYDRVMNEPGFGMLMEDTGAKFFMGNDDKCQLYTVGELQDRHFAFGFQEGQTGQYSLKRNFTKALNQISELGLLAKHQAAWWPENEKCGLPVVESFAPRTTLTTEEMAPPLVFLLAALLTAFIVALVELMVHLSSIAYPVHNKSFRENEKAPSCIGSLKTACCPCLEPDEEQPLMYKNMRPSVATQTVLWASSRATTPTPHSPHGTLSQRIF